MQDENVRRDENLLFECLFECIHALLLFMSLEMLCDVAMMHVDLFSAFSAERMDFLINSLIDSVVPVLLFRAKKSFLEKEPVDNDQFAIPNFSKLLIDVAIPKLFLAVIEHVKDDDSRVFKLIELTMLLREKIWMDLFQILSFSRKPTRKRMANIMFHYYPSLMLSDVVVERARREDLTFQYNPWTMTPCENLTCSSHGQAASRICLNGQATVAATFGQSSIPLYICEVCFQEGGQNEWAPVIDQHKPLKNLSLECENRQCNHELAASFTG